MTMPDPQEPRKIDYTQRDTETFLILGGFLAFLALLVLAAGVWQLPGHARVVNVGAGFVLLAIGLGMAAWGLVLRKRSR